MLRYRVTRCLLFLLMLSAGLSCDKTSPVLRYSGKTYRPGDPIQVEGSLALVGSRPHHQFVLIDQQGVRFILEGQGHKRLGSAQGMLQVRGRLTVKTLVTLKEKRRVYIWIIQPEQIKPVLHTP